MGNLRFKFRGKRVDNGEWVYGYYIQLDFHNSVDYVEEAQIVLDNGHVYVVDPETVGQYTGLKDKNGTEVYEGDIVGNLDLALDHFDYYEVIYHPKEASFIMVNKPENDRFDMTIAYHGEIIGNIHETPDLVKGE
jgi:uncharacterized phage protein (TIGR01671 family)